MFSTRAEPGETLCNCVVKRIKNSNLLFSFHNFTSAFVLGEQSLQKNYLYQRLLVIKKEGRDRILAFN
jgi:hypothetical protein